MPSWPRGILFSRQPAWPGRMAPILQRKRSPFAATLRESLQLLDREVRALKATRATVSAAFASIQLDAAGQPLWGARPEHPGVVFTCNTRYGLLAIPCDTYADWQANVRAIALVLEALRKVDRYGVTSHGEQYAGFTTREDVSA